MLENKEYDGSTGRKTDGEWSIQETINIPNSGLYY